MTQRRGLPDFFLLGAAKCGTTSLHAWLQQHPQLCMSRPKEPRFFSGGFELGLDWYRRHCFEHARAGQLLGDASHRNLYHSHVPGRIQVAAPEARFIVLIRDPVDRALAHWWTEYRRGREWLTFDESIRLDWERVRYGIESVPRPVGEIEPDRRVLLALGCHRNYLDGGHYAEQLERYFRLFPRDRFRILTLGSLSSDPKGVLRRLCEFLGIDPEPAERLDVTPINEARRLRFHLRRRPAQVLQQWRATRPLGGVWSRLAQLRERPPIGPETRAFLEQHYAPHDARLRSLLGPEVVLWPERRPSSEAARVHGRGLTALPAARGR